MPEGNLASNGAFIAARMLTIHVIVLSALATFLSCAVHAADRVKIGFMLKTMQEERYKKDRAVFLAKAKAMGAVPLFDSSRNNEMEQLARFENMLDQGVKVIVLQPVNTQTASILVNMANKRGVRVVGYDSLPMNSPLDFMVMQDSWAVGRLQGEALVKWFGMRKGGKVEGKVALIMGQPGDSNAFFMSEGAIEVLRAHEGLELLIQESHEQWDPAKAQKTTEEILSKHGDQVNAFICNNDGLARGVLSALRKKNLDHVDWVFVAGADADLANVRYVAQGIQAVDVWKMTELLAGRAAEVAVKLARHPEKQATEIVTPDKTIFNGLMEVPTIVTPVKLVTRDNINETLIAGGVYTRGQIYGSQPISEPLR
jgi:D-xylose transport system substrate-binding protein